MVGETTVVMVARTRRSWQSLTPKQSSTVRTLTVYNYQFEQKMVDALLSIDLVHASLKGKTTHVALVAGESDFVPAIEVARSESASVWLFHGSRTHLDLWSVADERVQLTNQFVSGILR